MYYQYQDARGTQKCCVGKGGSVQIYFPSTKQYLWYNCPATTQTQPHQCHSDDACIDEGSTTSNSGGMGVDECCSAGFNTFNVLGFDVCVSCTAPFQPPAISQNILQNQNRTISGVSSPTVRAGVLIECLFALLQVHNNN